MSSTARGPTILSAGLSRLMNVTDTGRHRHRLAIRRRSRDSEHISLHRRDCNKPVIVCHEPARRRESRLRRRHRATPGRLRQQSSADTIPHRQWPQLQRHDRCPAYENVQLGSRRRNSDHIGYTGRPKRESPRTA